MSEENNTPEQAPQTPETPQTPKAADPFDISGRKDFGIITVVVLFVVLIGAAVYLFSHKSGGTSVTKAPKLGPDDVASVGSKIIKKGDVDYFISDVFPALTAGTMQAPPEMLKMQLAQDENFCRQFLGQMLVRESIMQFAESQGVFETAEFKKRYSDQLEMVAVTEMFKRLMDVKPTEEEKHKFWEDDKRWFTGKSGEKAPYDQVKDMVPTAMGRQKILDYLEAIRKAAKISTPNWDGPVIATVEGDAGQKQEITLVQFEEEAGKFPEEQQAELRSPDGREKLLRQMGDRFLAVEEAKRQGLVKDPKVIAAAEHVRANVAAERLAKDLLGNGLEKKVDEKYEQVKTQPEYRNARYHVAHILVRMKEPVSEEDKQKARAKMADIQKRLKAGEDFAKLAKAQSEDTNSGANGGDLGVRAHAELVPEFANALGHLSKGQISDVIQTEFGLHIVKALEDPQYTDDPAAAKALIRKDVMKEGFQMVEQKAKDGFPVFVNDAAALTACGIDPNRPQKVPHDGLSLEDLARESQTAQGQPAGGPPAGSPHP